MRTTRCYGSGLLPDLCCLLGGVYPDAKDERPAKSEPERGSTP
jgi:hypothetical protein